MPYVQRGKQVNQDCLKKIGIDNNIGIGQRRWFYFNYSVEQSAFYDVYVQIATAWHIGENS